MPRRVRKSMITEQPVQRVFVLVGLKAQDELSLRRFTNRMNAAECVKRFDMLSGEHDFLVELEGSDLNDVYRLRKLFISGSPDVKSTNTLITY